MGRLFAIASLVLALQPITACATSQQRVALCQRNDGCVLDERDRRGPRGSDRLEVTPIGDSPPNLPLDLNIDGYFNYVGELLLPGQTSGGTCGGAEGTQMFEVSSLDARPGTHTPGFLTIAEMSETYSTVERTTANAGVNVGLVLANLLSELGIAQTTAANVGAEFANNQTSIVSARGKYIEVRLSNRTIQQLRDKNVTDGDSTQRAHLFNCILQLSLSQRDQRLLTGLSGFYMESLETNSNFNHDFEFAVNAAVSNPEEQERLIALSSDVMNSINGRSSSLIANQFRLFSQETFSYGAIAYTSPYTFFLLAGQGSIRIPALGRRRLVEICNQGAYRPNGTSNNYVQVVIANRPGRQPAPDVNDDIRPLQTHGPRSMRCRSYGLEDPLSIEFYDMDTSNQNQIGSIEGTVAFFR